MFQYQVESFFTHYILDTSNPVGKVKEYAIKIGFQEHGSPHVHCLLWVDGAPHIDVGTDDDVCSFIDMCVSGIIPNNSNGNKHISKMVKKYEDTLTFKLLQMQQIMLIWFPKTPFTTHTLICREPGDNDQRDDILKKSCEILT